MRNISSFDLFLFDLFSAAYIIPYLKVRKEIVRLEIDRYIAAPADPYKIRKKGETSCYDRVKGR